MPVYELLEGKGYEVKLAHTKETRIIAKAKVKTDKVDSERLAHLLRSNLLPTSYVPPKEIRELRDLVRLRTYLVVERTRFKNKIRAELAKRGIHVFRNPFTRKGSSSLKGLGIKSVDGCLAVISEQDARIRELSAEIERKAVENEDARLLMSIPGFGCFSALAIVAEIGDVSRFPDEEKLCSYAGLAPYVDQSGSTAHGDRGCSIAQTDRGGKDSRAVEKIKWRRYGKVVMEVFSWTFTFLYLPKNVFTTFSGGLGVKSDTTTNSIAATIIPTNVAIIPNGCLRYPHIKTATAPPIRAEKAPSLVARFQ